MLWPQSAQDDGNYSPVASGGQPVGYPCSAELWYSCMKVKSNNLHLLKKGHTWDPLPNLPRQEVAAIECFCLCPLSELACSSPCLWWCWTLSSMSELVILDYLLHLNIHLKLVQSCGVLNAAPWTLVSARRGNPPSPSTRFLFLSTAVMMWMWDTKDIITSIATNCEDTNKRLWFRWGINSGDADESLKNMFSRQCPL